MLLSNAGIAAVYCEKKKISLLGNVLNILPYILQSKYQLDAFVYHFDRKNTTFPEPVKREMKGWKMNEAYNSDFGVLLKGLW